MSHRLSHVLRMVAGAPAYWCLGCNSLHRLPIESTQADGKIDRWAWDGDVERPSFSPSVLVTASCPDEGIHSVCHAFVEHGTIRFLADCTHSLAGKTVAMVPLPDWFTWNVEE